MDFTIEYEEKKEFILLFLEQYDILDYDQYKQFIVNKDEEMLDYWLCDDDNCAHISINNLRKELPKYTRLFIERESNDGDHDSFECCNICGKNLNKYLTYYEDELNYLIETIQTKKDLIEESNSFKLIGLLQSTGWLSDDLNSEEAKNKLLSFIDKLIVIIE